MSRPKNTLLSASQKRILEALLKMESHGQPGFISDLVAALNLRAESSLTPTLERMVRSGFLLLSGGGVKGRQRLAQISPKGRLLLGVGFLPLLGEIPAGPLQEAIAQHAEAFSFEQLLPWRAGDFLLEVKGDSMIGDGILEGDKVLLRPDIEIQSGEIAAVLVSEESGGAPEATLKRVYFQEPESVILRASNTRYPDRVLDGARVKIAGVYRGLIRAMGRHA
jgi:repressor LexA